MKLNPLDYAIILGFILLMFLITGCVSTVVTLPDGSRFERTAFASKTQVGDVEVMVGTNAMLKLKGYSNDQTQAIEAAVRGAVEAAMKVK